VAGPDVQEAAQVLINALATADPAVRAYAAESLARLGAAKPNAAIMVPLLNEALRDTDADMERGRPGTRSGGASAAAHSDPKATVNGSSNAAE
jgi:hypothetical protein